MKKISLILLLLISSLSSYAQSETGCHERYVRVFEIRGANNIADGTYDDVIITVRKGSFEDCFIGKVKVLDGKVDRSSLSLTFVDGTFEKFERAYKNDDAIKIINGMSETMVTKDDELINVLFVSSIKPKKKAYKRAPEPNFNL